MRTLIIEDHLAMIEGYKSILELAEASFKFDFHIAKNCDEAVAIINNPVQYFELVLLDINLPPSGNNRVTNGKDLALLIQQRWKDAKIVILTSHIEKLVLYSLVKDIEPRALLVKSDFTPDELINSIRSVLRGETKIYSSTVTESIHEVSKEKVYLDAINREILQLLAKGVKTKNLPNHLLLSQSAIDKRKAHLKEVLGVPKSTEEDLICQAKKVGLI
ncbi:response regulator [Flavobacterium selenitireducens]|uniref:response regulator n=1 Tax=Flavobacterium selenitireducens TaxID=2722704 RepID=UPI00168BCF40|nr:response regulator [Flavobacterium selenitireducens]MBD3582140.1 response regulator transcription factor [Flavobacterium selenitireducens]